MSSPRTKSLAESVSRRRAPISSSQARPRGASATGENPRLIALKRRHFPKKGRVVRVASAQQALAEVEKIGSTFKIDNETLKSLAEDPDLECV